MTYIIGNIELLFNLLSGHNCAHKLYPKIPAKQSRSLFVFDFFFFVPVSISPCPPSVCVDVCLVCIRSFCVSSSCLSVNECPRCSGTSGEWHGQSNRIESNRMSLIALLAVDSTRREWSRVKWNAAPRPHPIDGNRNGSSSSSQPRHCPMDQSRANGTLSTLHAHAHHCRTRHTRSVASSNHPSSVRWVGQIMAAAIRHNGRRPTATVIALQHSTLRPIDARWQNAHTMGVTALVCFNQTNRQRVSSAHIRGDSQIDAVNSSSYPQSHCRIARTLSWCRSAAKI